MCSSPPVSLPQTSSSLPLSLTLLLPRTQLLLLPPTHLQGEIQSRQLVLREQIKAVQLGVQGLGDHDRVDADPTMDLNTDQKEGEAGDVRASRWHLASKIRFLLSLWPLGESSAN